MTTKATSPNQDDLNEIERLILRHAFSNPENLPAREHAIAIVNYLRERGYFAPPAVPQAAVELCDVGHYHARLAVYQGCPECLRIGRDSARARAVKAEAERDEAVRQSAPSPAPHAEAVTIMREALERLADPNQNDFEDWKRKQEEESLENDWTTWMCDQARAALGAAGRT